MSLLSYIRHDVFKRPYKLAKSIDIGQGKNVLLIHGIGAKGTTWQPLVDLIDKKQWHTLAYDLLGFGNSPKPENKLYDVNDHAESLVASIDRNIKKEKLVIIGHSMGCLIASDIATRYPKMVEHLILYEPPLFADSTEFRSHARRKRLYFALYEEILKRPTAVFNYSKIISKFSEGRALSVSKQSWMPFERSLKNTIMKQQAYHELEKITVPTDIIYGKYDFMVTRNKVTKMLQSNKNITFHLVKEMHDITNRAAKYIIKIMKPLY